MSSRVFIYIGLVLFLIKSGIVTFMMLDLLDVTSVPHILSEKSAYGILSAIDILLAGYLVFRRAPQNEFMRSGLIVLLMANALICAAVLFYDGYSEKFSVFASLFGNFKEGLLFYFLHGFSAFAYFRLSLSMGKPSAKAMNGWQRPFETAFIAYATLTLIYFLDLLRLTFLLSIQLLAIFWLLNVFILPRGWRSLNTGQVRTLFVGTLAAPFLLVTILYFWPVLSHLDESAEFVEDLAQAISETKITRAKAVVGESPESIGFVPEGFQETGSQLIVSDAWLLPDGHWMAVSNKSLLKTTDWKVFSKLADFDVPVTAIRFSADGKLGWAKAGYEDIVVTYDGGKNWTALKSTQIYSELTGKAYNDGFLDFYSDIFMNTETGFGAFTLKCQYLYTSDFGKHWAIEKLVDEKGKKLCVDDTPFSMSPDRSLAVVGTLGSDSLYQLDKAKGYWEPVCGLDEGSLFLGREYCSSKKDLTDKQKTYLEQLDKQNDLLRADHYYYDLFSMIADDAYYPVDELNKLPNQTAGTHFVSSLGNIMATDNGGESWQLLQSQFDFNRLIPVDGERAYAWTDDRLWLTNNYGQTWRPVDTMGERVRDFLYNPAKKAIWLLTANHLLVVDIENQQTKQSLALPNIKYTDLGRSADGRSLWAFHESDRYALVSFDEGAAWQRLAVRPGLDDYGDISAQSISAMYCESTQAECYLITSGGSIVVYGVDESGSFNLKRKLTLSDDIIESLYNYSALGIIVSNGGGQIALVLAGGNDAYVSQDFGNNWSRVAFYSNGGREDIRFSDQGSVLVVKGEDFLNYSVDNGNTWKSVNPGEDWGSDDMEWCSDADARHIYVYSQYDLAYSGDGGHSWKNGGSNNRLPFYCGFANDYLWIKQHQMHVYHKTMAQPVER